MTLPSPGHQNLPNASPSTTSLPPARVIPIHCSQSLKKLWFLQCMPSRSLKLHPSLCTASLPPSSWSGWVLPPPAEVSTDTRSWCSLLSQLWTQQLLLSVLPMGLRTPLPPAALSSAHSRHMQPSGSRPSGHSCRISNLPPKCPREHVGQQFEPNSITLY